MSKNQSSHSNNKMKSRYRSSLRSSLSIGLLALFLAMILGGPIEILLRQVDIIPAIVILLVVLGFSVGADIIGVAVTAANDVPLNAMASDKVPGAKEALAILRNAGKVNSFCADVIGDIAGTISGVIAAPIILILNANYPRIPNTIISMGVIGLIAFLTVGGKASQKEFAVRNSTSVVLFVGKVIYWIKKLIPGKSH
jgi:CBS domain containing-hemolysin-like protein